MPRKSAGRADLESRAILLARAKQLVPLIASRVVQARTAPADLMPQRVWTLHKGGHAAALDLRPVPGVGAEVVLTEDGELRKTRLFRSHEQAELVGAIPSWRMPAKVAAESEGKE